MVVCCIFFFKQKTAYEMRISDWSSDVCSSDLAEDTKAWVIQENEVTKNYLSQILYRNAIKNRLENLWNYEKFTAPYKEGDFTYFSKNDGLQNQYVLYRQKGEENAEVFLDPNKFSAEGTTSLDRKSVV